MKFKLLALAASLVLSQSAFAKWPLPQTCPSVGAFMDTGVTDAYQDSEGKWVGEMKSKFNTTSLWTLIVGRFDAGSVSEALGLANLAISGLSFVRGPNADDLPDGCSLCLYQGKDAFAVALYGFDGQSRSMIKRFLVK